ncbi:MAG: DUF1257 domain-containing protein [Planctomycetia bacterium]|nr:DUF1257 domain-containing protein [Planctomycetia bacterium]
MSHIVTVQTQLRDPLAVAAACARLQLPAPVEGTAQLYSGQAAGLLVQLPDWKYPLVIDCAQGELRFDDYGGQWGDRRSLDHFLQTYAIEKVRIEGRQRGYQVTEQALADGSVKLQLQEHV